MTIVVISKNSVVHPDTGDITTSNVYHSIIDSCGNAPKSNSPHYFEVDEEIAKAFGRKKCALCIDTKERLEWVKAVNMQLENSLLENFAESLPENFEVRVYVHGRNKQPKKVWSSYDIKG